MQSFIGDAKYASATKCKRLPDRQCTRPDGVLLTPISLGVTAKQRKSGWCPPPATMECSYCHQTYTAASRYEDFLANFRDQYQGLVNFPDKHHILKEKCGPQIKPWPVSTPLEPSECKKCRHNCDAAATTDALAVVAATAVHAEAEARAAASADRPEADHCCTHRVDIASASITSDCDTCALRVATALLNTTTTRASASAARRDTVVHCNHDEAKRILSIYRLYVLEEALAVHCYKHKDSCFKKGHCCRFRYPRMGLPESQFVQANAVPCTCDHCLEHHTDDSVCGCCTCPAETFIPTVDLDMASGSSPSSNPPSGPAAIPTVNPASDPAAIPTVNMTTNTVPNNTDVPSENTASNATTECSQCKEKACSYANSTNQTHSLRYRQIRPLGAFRYMYMYMFIFNLIEYIYTSFICLLYILFI